LTLIRVIALLHQYQRPVKVHRRRGEELRYIEVTREDLRLANCCRARWLMGEQAS
jgi:hypothetical protein